MKNYLKHIMWVKCVMSMKNNVKKIKINNWNNKCNIFWFEKWIVKKKKKKFI
jgi:hypothetical protein